MVLSLWGLRSNLNMYREQNFSLCMPSKKQKHWDGDGPSWCALHPQHRVLFGQSGRCQAGPGCLPSHIPLPKCLLETGMAKAFKWVSPSGHTCMSWFMEDQMGTDKNHFSQRRFSKKDTKKKKGAKITRPIWKASSGSGCSFRKQAHTLWEKTQEEGRSRGRPGGRRAENRRGAGPGRGGARPGDVGLAARGAQRAPPAEHRGRRERSGDDRRGAERVGRERRKACDGSGPVAMASLSFSSHNSPRKSHWEDGERERNGRACPGAASVASGPNPTPPSPAPRPQPRPRTSPGPPPRRGPRACACAGAALRSRAPHPPPEPPSVRHVTLVRLHLRAIPGPAPTWSALHVGRASAWPQPLAPPLPELGPAHKSLIVWLQRARWAFVSESFSTNTETEKSNIFMGTPFFTPLLPKAHINGGFHIELSSKKNWAAVTGERKQGLQWGRPLPRCLVTVSMASARSRRSASPRGIESVSSSQERTAKRGQRGTVWKRNLSSLRSQESRKGKGMQWRKGQRYWYFH